MISTLLVIVRLNILCAKLLAECLEQTRVSVESVIYIKPLTSGRVSNCNHKVCESRNKKLHRGAIFLAEITQ